MIGLQAQQVLNYPLFVPTGIIVRLSFLSGVFWLVSKGAFCTFYSKCFLLSNLATQLLPHSLHSHIESVQVICPCGASVETIQWQAIKAWAHHFSIGFVHHCQCDCFCIWLNRIECHSEVHCFHKKKKNFSDKLSCNCDFNISSC